MKQFTKIMLALTLVLTMSLAGVTAKAEEVSATQYDGEGSINILNTTQGAFERNELLAYSFDLTSEDDTAEFKITVPSGVLVVGIESNFEVVVQVYDETGKSYNSESEAFIEGLAEGTTRVRLEAGTYIIKLTTLYKSLGAKGNINFFALNSKEKVMKSDTTMVSNLLEDGRTKFKIWVPSDSNIYVETFLVLDDLVTVNGGVNVRILNSEGTAITSKYITTEESNYVCTFSLKKGTYYIEVSGGTGALLAYFSVDTSYKIKNGGSTKEKAAELTGTKKYIKFNADAKEKNVQWFKFTLKKPAIKSINIGCQTLNSSKYKITVYSGKTALYNETLDFSIITDDNYMVSTSIFYANLFGTKTEFPKGTYYVKIEELSKYCNGTLAIVLE